ncbi:unnamed protein product [Fraxinus pennsylvanica]|uniref:PGG domain-containing protein n=1 Tax=Fraxinus pennsylvanica TaxID=56036 RepID=A0AAD2DIN9_9LAMI|nr:unnamed protein product [Fraxinus pennsylvanica]
MDAAQDLDIIVLYNSIRENPQYLEVPNEMPFAETPLHIAASEGRTTLALEILRLKPTLGNKLNLDGNTPLDLALRNRHTTTVKRLVRKDPDLIRVPGRGGITPLHYAAETDENIDLLIRFLLLCPSSIMDLTNRDETAVHIAVQNQNLRGFKVLLGWLRRSDNTKVLSFRDEDGNTVLHLAALTNQLQVMKLLVGMVDVNAKNGEDNTALDIVEDLDPQCQNVDAREILRRARAKHGTSPGKDATSTTRMTCEDYLSSGGTLMETLFKVGAYMQFSLSGDMRNSVLVVAVLIATATYEADPTHSSTVINATSSSTIQWNEHPVIAVLNTLAFGMAIGTCVLLTFNPLFLFLYFPLGIFSFSYAATGYDGLSSLGAVIIFIPLIVSIGLPVMMIVPWNIVRRHKWEIENQTSSEYSLDEVKYRVFTSKYASRKLQ